MKKRIGTREYDTDTSELISDVGVGVLYRKRTRGREWFLVKGDRIEPIEEPQALDLLGGSARQENLPRRVTISIDRETHAIIDAAAKAHGITIAEEVRRLARHVV